MVLTYHSPGVYVEEKPAGSRPIEGVGTAIAGFVGFTEKGPSHEATLVTNPTQFFQTFGGCVQNTYLPLAVSQYFNNGGGMAYIVRVNSDANGDAPASQAELTSASRADVSSYKVIARDSTVSDLSVVIERGGPVSEAGDAKEGDDATFTLIVRRGGNETERFEGLQPKARGKQAATAIVNEQSELIRLQEVGQLSAADRLPVGGEVPLSKPPTTALAVTPDEYAGDAAARTGIGGLDAIDDITMVAVPDLMALYEQGSINIDDVLVIQHALVDHCARMKNRVAILDTPPELNAQQVGEFVREKMNISSPFATVYWPWIKVADPATGSTILMPPSGAIAGIWGRNDNSRGVHKAPANEDVRGAIDIALNVTRFEHDTLNPAGINVIRKFTGQGIRVWGARTLAGSSSEWRYLNVRRYFNFLEASILNGTQWVVFEPNDFDLWQRIARTIDGFLRQQWRNGALFGATPEQAYYIKCDEELNPAAVRDAGYVICEIGVAPVKPAEFVVFTLSQFSGGSDVSE